MICLCTFYNLEVRLGGPVLDIQRMMKPCNETIYSFYQVGARLSEMDSDSIY